MELIFVLKEGFFLTRSTSNYSDLFYKLQNKLFENFKCITNVVYYIGFVIRIEKEKRIQLDQVTICWRTHQSQEARGGGYRLPEFRHNHTSNAIKQLNVIVNRGAARG
jgi:hypothetical protein